jgi:hypothetical protein
MCCLPRIGYYKSISARPALAAGDTCSPSATAATDSANSAVSSRSRIVGAAAGASGHDEGLPKLQAGCSVRLHSAPDAAIDNDIGNRAELEKREVKSAP